MTPVNGGQRHYWSPEEIAFQEALGRQIAAARKERGWTQLALAEELGYSRASIAGIERGLQAPTAYRLARIVQLLGLSGLPTVPTMPQMPHARVRKHRERARMDKAVSEIAPVVCCEAEAMGIEGAGHSPGCPTWEERKMAVDVWLDGDRLIVKHLYGGCYDVVEIDNMGAVVEEELSELPKGAVRLVPEDEL